VLGLLKLGEVPLETSGREGEAFDKAEGEKGNRIACICFRISSSCLVWSEGEMDGGALKGLLAARGTVLASLPLEMTWFCEFPVIIAVKRLNLELDSGDMTLPADSHLVPKF
jgi:hypothetical protein